MNGKKIVSSKCQSKGSWRVYTKMGKAEQITRNKDFYLTIKGAFCEEDITTLSV